MRNILITVLALACSSYNGPSYEEINDPIVVPEIKPIEEGPLCGPECEPERCSSNAECFDGICSIEGYCTHLCEIGCQGGSDCQ